MFAIASLFAIVGRFLDGYSYLARGDVFANAPCESASGDSIKTLGFNADAFMV
jgi:hypothetical protein